MNQTQEFVLDPRKAEHVRKLEELLLGKKFTITSDNFTCQDVIARFCVPSTRGPDSIEIEGSGRCRTTYWHYKDDRIVAKSDGTIEVYFYATDKLYYTYTPPLPQSGQ